MSPRMIAIAAFVAAAILGWCPNSYAACTFTNDDDNKVMFLDGDCTTDETIFIPDGWTLDGQGFAITAVDPPGGHFLGAVVQNLGGVAHVRYLVVNTQDLDNMCDGSGPPDNRLRGIMFASASGTIWQNTVQNINQGPSGCQEGNAIEVRNPPFDGRHLATKVVEIAHNVVQTYQKTGIVCNGDVDCDIHHNFVGESATQLYLAANSVQIGFGATGTVHFNHVAGNQWFGTSDFCASAVLLFRNAPSMVGNNNIGGNSDVGIFVVADMQAVDNNRVFDGGPDGPNNLCDVGIWDAGSGNDITNNKIRGFEGPATALVGATVGVVDDQKVIPSPAEPEVCFGTDC